MSNRNTLQADALKLVAKKLQSSLAVEGELPEDGLAAYGDDGDDLMLTLARKRTRYRWRTCSRPRGTTDGGSPRLRPGRSSRSIEMGPPGTCRPSRRRRRPGGLLLGGVHRRGSREAQWAAQAPACFGIAVRVGARPRAGAGDGRRRSLTNR